MAAAISRGFAPACHISRSRSFCGCARISAVVGRAIVILSGAARRLPHRGRCPRPEEAQGTSWVLRLRLNSSRRDQGKSLARREDDGNVSVDRKTGDPGAVRGGRLVWLPVAHRSARRERNRRSTPPVRAPHRHDCHRRRRRLRTPGRFPRLTVTARGRSRCRDPGPAPRTSCPTSGRPVRWLPPPGRSPAPADAARPAVPCPGP